MKLKPLPRTKHQTKLSNHIHIRLTNSDYQQIQMLAEEVNLSMSEFVRRGVTRRAIPRQLAAFDLKAHSCQVKKVELLSMSEYAQIGSNENENRFWSGRGKRQSPIAFFLSV